MKKCWLILIAVSALFAVACDNKNESPEPAPPIEEGVYYGTLSVNQNDGTYYTQDDVKIVVDVNDGVMDMKMFKVKFSDRMPITLDMTVKGITAQTASGGYRLSAEGIVPQAMGEDFPEYTITGMTGNLTEDRISFNLMCGEFPPTFTGRATDNVPVEPEEPEEPENPEPLPGGRFSGTFVVELGDGTDFEQENTQITVSLSEETAYVLILDVTFHPKMPLRDDLFIPGLTIEQTDEIISLSGDGIVPLYGKDEFETYTVTGFNGTLEDDLFSFSMACGSNTMYYSGSLMVVDE